MVEAIVHGEYAIGHDALVQHTALLQERPPAGDGRHDSKRSPKAGR
jgi:hypothetical protein